jgi:F-type H+-transporting ATPase subunit b
MKDGILAEAKAAASLEGDKIMTAARESIQQEKMAAITELKNQVAALSIEIAEKILKDELSSAEKQKALIDNVVKDIVLN